MKPKLIGGFLLPLIVLTVGMLGLTQVESAAGAAEFAGLGVLFALLAAIPLTIVANLFLLPPRGEIVDYFKKGMVVPLIAIVWAVLYNAGIWDALF